MDEFYRNPIIQNENNNPILNQPEELDNSILSQHNLRNHDFLNGFNDNASAISSVS